MPPRYGWFRPTPKGDLPFAMRDRLGQERFHRHVVRPRYQQRQLLRAARGQGQLHDEFLTDQSKRALKQLNRGDDRGAVQRLLAANRAGGGRTGIAQRNPQLSISRPEIRRAISESRRIGNNSSGNLLPEGKWSGKR